MTIETVHLLDNRYCMATWNFCGIFGTVQNLRHNQTVCWWVNGWSVEMGLQLWPPKLLGPTLIFLSLYKSRK